MQRDLVLEIVRAHRAELTEMKVKSLRLFGSVAREEAVETSDVDFVVEFSEPVGYFHLFRVQDHLEALLGRPVDLVPDDAIKPRMRGRIIRDAISAA